MRFRKKNCGMSILCSDLVCGGGETKSPCKSYADKKTTKNGKYYLNDAWKGYLKTWDR